MRGEAPMTCDEARARLLDYQRGSLPAVTETEVRGHLEGCAACAHADAVERELTRVLEHRLPQHPASLALKRRLATQWQLPERWSPRWRRWRPFLLPVAVAATVVLIALPVLHYERTAWRETFPAPDLISEAVNDHLRVLASQRPLEIESGGIHQVKPWFEGRLDFAPVVSFEGDADFALRGGAVGYFFDRKAAVFIFARRLHLISLLVFRAEGLPLVASQAPTAPRRERGFNVITWRRGDLGYVLVSDVDPRDLEILAARLTAAP